MKLENKDNVIETSKLTQRGIDKVDAQAHRSESKKFDSAVGIK